MINHLRGQLVEKSPPIIILEVNGIGYELEASMNTFYHLPDTGSSLTLYTHFVVREDAHLLFGFLDEKERLLFRNLIKVNGVGPRLALSILSSMNPDEFAHCVMSGDSNSLVRIPGVGKKTAERLVLDMRDRLKSWHSQTLHQNANMTDTETPKSAKLLEREVIGALVALGYKPQEASRALTKIETNHSLEDMIRQALKVMAEA